MENTEIIKDIELPEELAVLKLKKNLSISFKIITGIVVSTDEQMEHKFRNRPQLGSPSSIKASSCLKSKMWIKKSNGEEELIQKEGISIKAREGHKIALVSVKTDNQDKNTHYSACYNFTTKEIIFSDDKLGILGCSIYFIGAFALALFIGFVLSMIFFYIDKNLGQNICALILITFPIIACVMYWFHANNTNRAINFINKKIIPYIAEQKI